MKRLVTSCLSASFTIAVFSFAMLSSCSKKQHKCFSAELKEQYTRVDCTNDCPGVIGCDGKKYCNVCIAGSQGIAVK